MGRDRGRIYRRRVHRRRAGKAQGENRSQIQQEENKHEQVLLPQQQDEQKLVGEHALPLSLLEKKHLHPVLNRNRREHGEDRDNSAQHAALLKNDHHRRDREQKQPGVIKAMIDRDQREDR